MTQQPPEGLEPCPADDEAVAERIVEHLLQYQERGVRAGTHDGSRSARGIAQVVSMTRADCRVLLRRLADAGRIKREECSNGLFWRSINPLPWEPGGALPIQHAKEREAWAGELSLVVQAVWTKGGHTMSRDVRAYPEALRERAEAHVQIENYQSNARREGDRRNNRHLNDGYSAPPSYRLVSLAAWNTRSPSPALAEAVKALEPFAAGADVVRIYDPKLPPEARQMCEADDYHCMARFTNGQVKAARTALANLRNLMGEEGGS